MTITNVYYAEADYHTGIFVEYIDNGEEGWRPVTLDEAKAIRDLFATAIRDAEKARAAGKFVF